MVATLDRLWNWKKKEKKPLNSTCAHEYWTLWWFFRRNYHGARTSALVTFVEAALLFFHNKTKRFIAITVQEIPLRLLIPRNPWKFQAVNPLVSSSVFFFPLFTNFRILEIFFSKTLIFLKWWFKGFLSFLKKRPDFDLGSRKYRSIPEFYKFYF